MDVQTLIYAYLAICISMIVFNCACIFVFRLRDATLQKRSVLFEERINAQIQRIKEGKPVEEIHKAFLQKKLPRINHLMALDETLERLLQREPEAVWTYLREIGSVFTYLVINSKYRSTMKITYFAYLVKKYHIIERKPIHPIVTAMMSLLQEPGLYCRENALQAIYSSGDCGCVLQALLEVDRSPRFHHAKLLTDGLLSFSGEHEQLINTLWKAFDQFSTRMKVVILDYIRFSGKDMCPQLLQLLADSHQDDEIRFSCIRYFGKHPYDPAFPLLISFASDPQDRRWEYAAISATSLAAYPCQRSIDVLKKALSNANWYIRFNAAKSLERFDMGYLELIDVMDGSDRYAREILQYRMDLKKARTEQKEALV